MEDSKLAIKVPALGEGIKSARVTAILVKTGDLVQPEQGLIEVESNKASLTIPASSGGQVTEICVTPGENIEIGQVIVILTSNNTVNTEAIAHPSHIQTATTVKTPNTAETKDTAKTANTTETKDTAKTPNTAETNDTAKTPNTAETNDTAKTPNTAETNDTAKTPNTADTIDTAKTPNTADTIDTAKTANTAETNGITDTTGTSIEARATSNNEAKPDIATSHSYPQVGTRSQVPPFASQTPTMLVAAAPSVRRLARELGADIHSIQGTGPDGRISIEDVKAHVKQLLDQISDKNQSLALTHSSSLAPPQLPDFSRFGKIRREKMSAIRQTIAEKMSLAWQQIPHVTQFDEADATALEEFRNKKNKALASKEMNLSLTAILLKIVALALRKFPQLNASIDMQNREIIYKEYVHLGVAVDTPQGLFVPVIRNIDNKTLTTINEELKNLARRTRENKPLQPQELEGSCLSLTNLGVFGTTHFTPIVNWPETAVLGVGRAKHQGIANASNGNLQPRLILPLSLSYDHRVVDGAEAARFLRWIAEAIEYPLDLL